MDKVAEKTQNAIAEKVAEMGYEIVDVEFVKKSDGKHLTVYIDIPRGVTLDDCEAVHHAIDPIIDELNPTGEEAYTLNISSPGLDRPFKKQRDYERNYGKEVEVKLYAPLKGKKYFEGTLIEKKDNAVVIETNEGQMQIEMTRISLVRPLVKFE